MIWKTLTFLTVFSWSAIASAQSPTCASATFEIQSRTGASLVHQGRSTIRLSHPSVREMQITCRPDLAARVDHIWVSAYGTAPDRSFMDMLEILWRLAGGKPGVSLERETRDCLRQSIAAFGPPDYFAAANSTGGNIDCTYGTVIDDHRSNKIFYSVTLKVRPDRR